VVILYKGAGNTGGGKIAFLVGFHKKTPLVMKEAGFNDYKALDRAGYKCKGHGYVPYISYLF